MICRKFTATTFPIERCHDGTGRLLCTEMLATDAKAGFRFVHDNVLEPGASIGEHTHEGDEEMYVIIEGEGVMRVDGVDKRVASGDICVTRSGHSHSLANTGDTPMRILVVGVGIARV